MALTDECKERAFSATTAHKCRQFALFANAHVYMSELHDETVKHNNGNYCKRYKKKIPYERTETSQKDVIVFLRSCQMCHSHTGMIELIYKLIS